MSDREQITYVRQVAYLGNAEKIRRAIAYEFGRKPTRGAERLIEQVVAERKGKPDPKLDKAERNAAIIRGFHEQGICSRELAETYGLARKTVQKIISGAASS